MNLSLRKEISNLGILAAAAALLAGKQKWAKYLGLASIGLRSFSVKNFSYENQSVVITGGSRGLGLALAEELSQQGALVTILARDEEELKRAKKRLAEVPSAQVLAITCDITNRHQLKFAFEKVKERYGKIDILINNAGAVSAGPFESMNQKDFEAQMNVHFFAALKSVQVILPIFKEKKSGCIVNISSIGGKIPILHMIPYCASKFALSGFSQALSSELRKDNIQVTTVYPGLMRTGSPIQGIFKGDHEKEFAWFAISDSTPGLTVSAKNAARQILSAVQSGETELVISVPAKLGTFFYANFPQIFTALMGFVNRFMPQDSSDHRKTGAQSQAWLKKQAWSRPFMKIMTDAQERYNEHPKFDPEFNLNVKDWEVH